MGKHRPVVLGCDPGESNSAFGIMGDGVILHSSLLYRATMLWDEYCVQFQDEITRLIGTFPVDLFAIENFSWHGEYAKVEPPIRELIGISRTFSRTIPVLVIQPKEWSHAITGTRPSNRGHDFEGSRKWKKTIRRALTTRLKMMDIDLDEIVGEDKGNHKVDALSLAIVCQDCAYIQSHERKIP